MSQHFIRIFGDMLQKTDMPEYPLWNPKGYLPPPTLLKRKILLKGSRGNFGAPDPVPPLKEQNRFINKSKTRLAGITMERIKEVHAQVYVLGRDSEKDKMLKEHSENPERTTEKNMSVSFLIIFKRENTW
uniref:Uncharacterized protein n=1 Tax=Panagrolaimus sp. PS1159 TaxID=55785 RepID=A0AC35F926_9BILA